MLRTIDYSTYSERKLYSALTEIRKKVLSLEKEQKNFLIKQAKKINVNKEKERLIAMALTQKLQQPSQKLLDAIDSEVVASTKANEPFSTTMLLEKFKS